MNVSADDLDWLVQPASYDARIVAPTDIPDDYRRWVDLDTSMTDAIRKQKRSDAEVTVHHAGDCTLCSFEAECLDARDGFARHVSLQAKGEMVLAARTVVRRDSALQSLLGRDNTRPLGALLFAEDRWRRLSVPVPLKDGSGLIGRFCSWRDRQSGEMLIVEEFFLPNLLQRSYRR